MKLDDIKILLCGKKQSLRNLLIDSGAICQSSIMLLCATTLSGIVHVCEAEAELGTDHHKWYRFLLRHRDDRYLIRQ